MREIKFRAWNEITKHMSYSGTWSLAGNCDLFNTVDEFFNSENHVRFMQFTGLKDKNGKEIYEGDVILSENFNSTHLVIWGPRIQATVIRHQAGWPPQYLDCEYAGWKVIGNIYENPELIKE